MKDVKSLKVLLNHEDNDPLDIIKVDGSRMYHYVGNKYCCWNTGWGGKDEGTIEGQEEKLMKVLSDIDSCVLIYLSVNTLAKLEDAFDREMHWINQQSIRIERWKYIAPVIFNKIKETIKGIDLESYVKENYDTLVKMLPVNARKVELDGMNRLDILEELSAGRISTKEADEFIRIYENKIYEENREKLCPFSGSGSDADTPKRICSRTNNPRVLGDCASCRVASEWEECYG